MSGDTRREAERPPWFAVIGTITLAPLFAGSVIVLGPYLLPSSAMISRSETHCYNITVRCSRRTSDEPPLLRLPAHGARLQRRGEFLSPALSFAKDAAEHIPAPCRELPLRGRRRHERGSPLQGLARLPHECPGLLRIVRAGATVDEVRQPALDRVRKRLVAAIRRVDGASKNTTYPVESGIEAGHGRRRGAERGGRGCRRGC